MVSVLDGVVLNVMKRLAKGQTMQNNDIIQEVENKKNKMIEILTNETKFWWSPLFNSNELINLSNDIHKLCESIKNENLEQDIKSMFDEIKKK